MTDGTTPRGMPVTVATNLRRGVYRAVRWLGFDVVRFSPLPARDRLRVRLIHEREIDVVLDVGASAGKYATSLRAAGYTGRIISFEPLSSSFERLEVASAGDPNWHCLRVGLHAHSGAATLNISANEASSSFRAMERRHVETEPRSAYVDSQECEVTTIDALGGRIISPTERAYVKLDVQGCELDVLRGAERTIEQIEILEAELSLVPLYSGAPSLDDVVRHLDERGLGLISIEPAWVDPVTRTILQVDGIFARTGSRHTV